MAWKYHENNKGCKRGRTIRFFCIRLLICVGIVYATVCGVLYHYMGKLPEDRILDHIYIGDVDVSGMTAQEARSALESHLDEIRRKSVTLKVDGKSAQATLEELGIGYQDIDTLVQKANGYGKIGNIWVRSWRVRRLEKEDLVLREQLYLDRDQAGAVIEERTVSFTNHASDARIEREDGDFKITEEKEGETINIESSIVKIEQMVNESGTHKDISVQMEKKSEKPKVTAAELEAIQDVLGTFSTDAGGGERLQNLKAGTKKLDGTVLMPGQELSFYAATSPYDAEHGYVEAGSYEKGQVVDTYGGGICQVSTTLYNAALFAELDVLERHPHSMLVSYAEPARDAAIAGDYMDLVLPNPYDTPVSLESGIDDENHLRFTIYGREDREQGRKIEFISEISETVGYVTVYREDREAELGSVKRAGDPHTGTTARLMKIVYQDGREISREEVNSSKYEKSDKIIEIGTATEDERAAAYVREAIESQEWEKIEEALDAVLMR